MFKRLLIFLCLMVNAVYATTFSNVQFETVSSNVNFISTRAITNQTVWIKSVLTNGAAAASKIERLDTAEFDPNEVIKLTNVNILGVFDRASFSNLLYSVAYNLNYTNCFEIEDVKHTTNFIVGTNLYFGRFDVPITGTRIQNGSILVFSNQYYLIRNISNVGTNIDEVELMYPIYSSLSNSTQNIQAVYGLKFNTNDVSYGDYAGNSNAMRIIGSFANISYPAGDSQFRNITPYDLSNEIFIVTRNFRMADHYDWAIAYEGDGIFYNYNKKYFKPFGNTAYRITSVANNNYRIKKYAEKSYLTLYPYTLGTTVTKSTNYLNDYISITITSSPTRYYTDATANSDGSIIYVSASSYPFGISGNGGYIYKSMDSGLTWNALTNMGTRYWTSLYTRDGTNLYAGTWAQGGTGYSATGGVYYSSDGGTNWILTNLRNSTYGANQVYYQITSSGASNIAVTVGYNSSGNTTNQGIWLAQNNDTNFYKWAQYSYPTEIVFHPSDTNTFYELTSYGQSPYGYGIFKATNNLRQGYFVSDTSEAFFHSAIFQAICFCPTNPNIGVVCYSYDYASAGRIFKTTNRGRTWTDISPSSQLWATIATWDGQTIYAANQYRARNDSSCTIYYTTNGGTSWSTLSQNVPNIVKMVMPNSNTVYGMCKESGYYSDTYTYTLNVLFELNTQENVVKLPGGRLNTTAYTGGDAGDACHRMKVYNTNNFYSFLGSSANGYGNIIITSTNNGDYFNFNPNVFLGANATICGMYVAKQTNDGYVSFSNAGILYKTTNFFKNLTAVDSSTGRYRKGVWVSDDGSIVYNTIYNTANQGLIKSTNFGGAFTTAVTNQANWWDVTSWDGGNTILLCRDNGTMGILTNAISTTNVTVSFITSSPSAYSFNTINSNKVWAFAALLGQYYESTNQGTSWTTKTLSNLSTEYIRYIEAHPSDTNTYWISAPSGIFITTNNFIDITRWNTNNPLQAISGSTIFAFDIDKINNRKFVFGDVGGLIGIYTNWPNATSTIIFPSFLSNLRASWTGISTYDGNTIYAAGGEYGYTTSTEYFYKIQRIEGDIQGGYWTYFDDRSKSWRDVNASDGIDIWACTRNDVYRSTTPPITTNYYSIVATCPIVTTNWIEIQDTLSTYNTYLDSGGEVYFIFSFDGNKSFLKWENSYWRAVVTNDSSWKYWNGSSYVNAYTNSVSAALSDAMSYTTNQMTYPQITGITRTNWSSSGGFNRYITNNISIGVTMRSTANRTPNISNFIFNYYTTTTNLYQKKNAVTDGYRIEYNQSNGVYSIYRTGTVVDTYIYYIRK